VGNLVERPAFINLVILPKVDVVLRSEFFEQALRFKDLEQVHFPVQRGWVDHLVAEADLFVNFLRHVVVVPDRHLVLHDNLVALERLFELHVDFVSQRAHI